MLFLLSLGLPAAKKQSNNGLKDVTVLSHKGMQDGEIYVCESWCSGHTTDWFSKCRWASGECNDCTECDAASHDNCATYCATDSRSWGTKCAWSNEHCSMCGPCHESPPATPPPPPPPDIYLAAAGASDCGSDRVVSFDECHAAVTTVAAENGKSPARGLQSHTTDDCTNDGGWGTTTSGCSAQTGGDWTAHFKKSSVPCGGFGGMYQLVCSRTAGSAYHFSSAGNMCDTGTGVTATNCEAAVASLAADKGLTPARSLQTGTTDACTDDGGWGVTPDGCSAQTAGDYAAHFKYMSGTCAGVGSTYERVCTVAAKKSCSCIPCGSSTPKDYGTGSCGAATDTCSATLSGAGCYTECAGECDCHSLTCTDAASK